MTFKLKSGNGPLKFKMMGSSPAKHPLEKEHTHPDEYKEEKSKVDVKGPEDSDVMDIIKKRKETGPQVSPEDQQAEIDKLVEKRDPDRKYFNPKNVGLRDAEGNEIKPLVEQEEQEPVVEPDVDKEKPDTDEEKPVEEDTKNLSGDEMKKAIKKIIKKKTGMDVPE